MTIAEQVEADPAQHLGRIETKDKYGVETSWVLYAGADEVTIQIFTGSASLHAYAAPEQMMRLRDLLTTAIEAAS